MSLPKLTIAKSIRTLVAATGATLAASAATAATVWDLRSDWSDLSNPNGPWSYNSDSTALPHISSTTLPGWVSPLPQGGWAACSSCRGFWFLSSSLPADVDWQVGDVVVHTQDQFGSPYDHAANVTWTSPISGLIDISGSVWMDDFYPNRGNQWNLYIGGSLVSSGLLSGSDPYDRSSPYSLLTGTGGALPLTNVAVSTGEVVKLEIVRTTFDGFFVGTNLTVSAVPEPGSCVLLMLGLGAVAAAKGLSTRRTTAATGSTDA